MKLPITQQRITELRNEIHQHVDSMDWDAVMKCIRICSPNRTTLDQEKESMSDLMHWILDELENNPSVDPMTKSAGNWSCVAHTFDGVWRMGIALMLCPTKDITTRIEA